MPKRAIFLSAIAATLSAATPASAASQQTLLLADGLMDHEAVCTIHTRAQAKAMEGIVANWSTTQRGEAVKALTSELLPLVSQICDATWAKARVKLADQIEASMPASDRAIVYKFLSSSGGGKFVSGARGKAFAMLNGAKDPGMPPLTAAERALWSATYQTPAWSNYKSFAETASTTFGQVRDEEYRPYAEELQRRIQAVRQRFGN